jgi:CO/xanthine dehydrogenase FAD-binding subunit
MSITFNRPDGLYLSAQATLSQLLEDEALPLFAAGLLHTAVMTTLNVERSTFNLSLAEALHHTTGPETYPLLTALLALDAEVQALTEEKRRVLPLAGFLSYRASLPPDKAPLEAVRLPPLNPGGRYAFAGGVDKTCLAVRLDLHETRRIAGHVRLAVSSPIRPPMRLHTVEDRLERQRVEAELIEAAVAARGEALTPAERVELVEMLKSLTG